MKAFNRFMLVAGLAFGASCMGTLSASAQTVNISGTVTSASSVTSANDNTALTLFGQGTAQTEVIQKAADLALFTNNTAGIDLTITSGNLSDGTTDIAFQVVTTADAGTPVAGDFLTASGVNRVEDISTGFVAGAQDRDLHVMYDTPALLNPGTYSGSITLTVADR